MAKKNRPCSCAVCQVVRHYVIPVAPSQHPDPWKMQPGDCQRALAAIWEAMQRSEPQFGDAVGIFEAKED